MSLGILFEVCRKPQEPRSPGTQEPRSKGHPGAIDGRCPSWVEGAAAVSAVSRRHGIYHEAIKR